MSAALKWCGEPAARDYSAPVQCFEDLIVWQRAMDLVDECYRISRPFPADERFGLTLQLRRAAISVAANIAEGNGRVHRKEYLHFLSMSKGSLNELRTYLLMSKRLEYAGAEALDRAFSLCDEVGRMLTGLRKSLQA